MNEGLKIADVARETGLSVRKIKFYTGTTSGKNRDPKFFTPSGFELRENGEIKYWKFSSEDVQKIKYIHMLELLDYKTEEIRRIMQSADYLSSTDFKGLLERIDQKISIYQGYKAYVMSLSSFGSMLWDANDFSAARMEDYFRLSAKRYGKILNSAQIVLETRGDEIFAAQEAAFAEFSKIRHLPVQSEEATQAALRLEAFTEMYLGSSTPLMMFVSYGLIPKSGEQVAMIDSEYGAGTAQYIADVVSYLYEEKERQIVQLLEDKRENGIDSEAVKDITNELIKHSTSIEKDKPDITLFLLSVFGGNQEEDSHDQSFASQAIENYFEKPLKQAIHELAKLRGDSGNTEEHGKKAAVLLGTIMTLFDENPVDIIEWICLIISDMKAIREGIDRVEGEGAATFVAEKLKQYYDALLASVMVKMKA